MRWKVLELFAGIGGAACAFEGMGEVVGAIDINQHAHQVYRANFDHRYFVGSVEDFSTEMIKSLNANTWWISAPCQPYTRRGKQLDDRDRRSTGLGYVIRLLKHLAPEYFFLENVVGFAESRSHQRLRETLNSKKYQFVELHRCPTELGIPNRRPRFYLIASLTQSLQLPQFDLKTEGIPCNSLQCYLDSEINDLYRLSPEVANKYLPGMNVVHPEDQSSNCFTSAYGKSISKSGSYLASADGSIRRFSPSEIARILGLEKRHPFKPYCFPDGLSDRQLWKLLGNSISARVVRDLILRIF